MQASIDAVRDSVQAGVADFESRCFRPLQKQAFLCSAKCCDGKSGDEQAFHTCLHACSAKVQAAEASLTAELDGLQQRLQRAMAVCQDKAATVVREGGSDGKAQGVLELCVAECANASAKEAPLTFARLRKQHG
jgi:hypothetical protein